MLVWDKKAWGFAREILLSNYRSAPAPYRLLFYLTMRCNCRCKNCLIWQSTPGTEISRDEVQRIFVNSAPHLRWLHLSGGEIFLRNDVLEIIQAAIDLLPNLFILQIATNCTLPERILEACRILNESRIPRTVITLSIDGVGSIHDRERGFPGLFDQVIDLYRSIKRFRSQRVRPYLGMTITRSNADRLPDDIRTLTDTYGVQRNDIHYNFYHQSEMYYQNDDSEVITPDQARNVVRFLQSIQPRGSLFSPESILERRYRKLYPDFLRTGRSPLKCEAFSGSLSISSNGDCYPCMGYHRSAGRIADFNYRLDELWRSNTVRAIRESIMKGQCPQCWTPCEAFQTMLTHSLPGHKP